MASLSLRMVNGMRTKLFRREAPARQGPQSAGLFVSQCLSRGPRAVNGGMVHGSESLDLEGSHRGSPSCRRNSGFGAETFAMERLLGLIEVSPWSCLLYTSPSPRDS
eukprot:TRINITY_DN1125_c0_g1_i4.p2 TRINITY_DN1125_c0_g1~~TRINITY_DN1125_c0_g1_i4.p2  ORF type:complete len:107 (+),score=6.26 TRINITY_DN1125_c0_g1_i4:235-555(+)